MQYSTTGVQRLHAFGHHWCPGWQDGVSATEYDIIDWLGRLSDGAPEAAHQVLTMPFLDSPDTTDVLGLSPNPSEERPWGHALEEAIGCSSESGIMVLRTPKPGPERRSTQ